MAASSSAWQGYFFKAVNVANDDTYAKDGTEFPMKYIQETSWSSTPKAREELKAYRDDNTRNLTRVTATGHKSSFSFSTRENLHLKDKKKIQKYFTNNESNSEQRKIQLIYWNDENNEYETAYFYRPDIEFPIKYVTDSDIVYDSFTVEFIEY